jgi:hypothetical protein
MPETSGPQQHRPAAACWALSAGSRGAGRSEDYKAEDADTLAPRRLSSLLALEIATARRSAAHFEFFKNRHQAPLCLRRVIATWRHLYASARLHERSCFFAQLSTNCFSSCSCLCLLGRIFKHQFSELMFDGDCRRKFDFSSEPMCAHWALLWTEYSI